jgi:hypothetical protein
MQGIPLPMKASPDCMQIERPQACERKEISRVHQIHYAQLEKLSMHHMPFTTTSDRCEKVLKSTIVIMVSMKKSRAVD